MTVFGSLKLELAHAKRDAETRPPGLVRRNWDLERPVVTIDHAAAAADLAVTLAEQHDFTLGDVDAKEAIAYALEGNTDAVLT